MNSSIQGAAKEGQGLACGCILGLTSLLKADLRVGCLLLLKINMLDVVEQDVLSMSLIHMSATPNSQILSTRRGLRAALRLIRSSTLSLEW